MTLLYLMSSGLGCFARWNQRPLYSTPVGLVGTKTKITFQVS
jgi:hypothetical protein